MNFYLIPFWTVFSVGMAVVCLLIWLSVVKSRDNQRIEVGAVGVRWMVEQYLDRALQKTVFHMIRYETLPVKKGMDLRLSIAREKLLETHTPLLTTNLVKFPRGKQVVNELYRELSSSTGFDNTNLFLLPDVLVHLSGNTFYYGLLVHGANVVTNDSALFDEYSNDDSKQYLAALLTHKKSIVDQDNNSSNNAVSYVIE
jgi:hypothetical protein